MTVGNWRGAAVWLVTGAAILATAATTTVLMYTRSPIVGLAVPLGLVAVAVIVRQPTAGVSLGLLAVPLEILHVRFGVSSVTFAENVFLLTAVVSLFHLVLGGRIRFHQTHLIFFALIVVALAGVFFAPNTAVVLRISRVWLAFLVVAVMVTQASRRQLEQILLALSISGALVGIIATFTTGQQQIQGSGELVSGRASTGFGQPNVLAFYLILALAPTLVLASRGPGWRRALMVPCAIGILGGLFLTLSRSGIAGAGVVLAVLLIWPRFRKIVAVLLLILVVFAAVNFSAIERSSRIATVSTRLSTLGSSQGVAHDPRTVIWKETPTIIADHFWLGVGEGNFPGIGPHYGLIDALHEPYDHAHDLFLTIAAELGIIGLAVLLALIASVVRTARAALRARGPDWPYVLAVSASLAGVLVTGIGDYPARTPIVLATILILVGVLAGYERLESQTAAR